MHGPPPGGSFRRLVRGLRHREAVLECVRRAGASGATSRQVQARTRVPFQVVVGWLFRLKWQGEIATAPHSTPGRPTRWVAVQATGGTTREELTLPSQEV